MTNLCKTDFQMIKNKTWFFVFKLTFILILTATLNAHAQTGIRITGTVRSDTETLPGANVMIKGTTIGVTTDLNGNYTINVPNADAILVFSFIGYQPQEQTIGDRRIIDAILTDNSQELDEVVVIGYGTVRKKDLTGAVGSVRRKDMPNISVSNVEQMVQGRVAGVEVLNSNGLPGSGTSIKIRGIGTIYNSDPLYIIDGMPGDINSVSQYDIESIDILKDASSTAIYGARAANGVVLVTTKKGLSGEPKVNLNASVGWATIGKKMDYLNANQYMDLALDIDPNFFNNAQRFSPVSQGGLGWDQSSAYVDRSNMQDEIFRTAFQQDYHINVSGGSNNSIYSISGGYTDQDAITMGYNFKQFTVMSNNEITIRKIVKIGQNLSVRRRTTEGISPDFVAAYRYAPYMPIEDPNNSWGYSRTSSVLDGSNDAFNAIAILNTNHATNKQTLIRELIYAEVSLFDMFKWRTQFVYTNDSHNRMAWNSYSENGDFPTQAKIEDAFSYNQGGTLENYLTFTKDFGIHSFNAMIGNTYATKKFNNGRSLTASGSADGTIQWENNEVLLITTTPKYDVNSNTNWYSAYLSYFGRINYTLMDKYLLTFNYRQDASPNFDPDHRWGRFPSLALAWKIDQEEFLRGVGLISQLKLRLSVGKSGNDRISSYAYYANLFSGGGNILGVFGPTQTPLFGVTINSLPATGIHWEESTSYNAGLDFGLWNGVLSGSVDVYKKNTDGILVRVPIAPSSGIDNAPFQNAAEVTNTGIDIALTYQKKIGDFSLSVSGIAGYNKNEVTSLGAGEPIVMAQQSIGYLTRTEVGHSVGEFYGYKVDKVLSTTKEADDYNQKYGLNVSAGDIAFKDIAGPPDANGNPTGPDGQIDDNDRTFIGKPSPNWNFGLNIGANYKNFDLQIGMIAVTGNSIFDYARIFELESMKRVFNQTTTTLDRWRKEGDVTDVPRAVSADPSNNLRASDRYVKNASYMKIRNITLGYTVPFKNNMVIDRLRVYVTCQNLLTITKYDGYDPEIGSQAGSQNYNLERGILYNASMIPTPRIFLFGIQATF